MTEDSCEDPGVPGAWGSSGARGTSGGAPSRGAEALNANYPYGSALLAARGPRMQHVGLACSAWCLVSLESD